MIKETTIYDFKTHFSRYLSDLEQEKYEAVIVKRRDEVVGEFRLKKPENKGRVKLGTLRIPGYSFDKELFDSADEEIADMFESSRLFPEGYDDNGNKIKE